jgi:hypothetical protein
MIYWAKRRAEIPFMKVLGDLQLKLGAPHELMMLSSHPLSHQDFEVFIGVPQRELLAPFEGFTEIQENELPDKLIALVIREANSTNASRQLLQSGVPRRKDDDPA